MAVVKRVGSEFINGWGFPVLDRLDVDRAGTQVPQPGQRRGQLPGLEARISQSHAGLLPRVDTERRVGKIFLPTSTRGRRCPKKSFTKP